MGEEVVSVSVFRANYGAVWEGRGVNPPSEEYRMTPSDMGGFSRRLEGPGAAPSPFPPIDRPIFVSDMRASAGRIMARQAAARSIRHNRRARAFLQSRKRFPPFHPIVRVAQRRRRGESCHAREAASRAKCNRGAQYRSIGIYRYGRIAATTALNSRRGLSILRSRSFSAPFWRLGVVAFSVSTRHPERRGSPPASTRRP